MAAASGTMIFYAYFILLSYAPHIIVFIYLFIGVGRGLHSLETTKISDTELLVQESIRTNTVFKLNW